MRYLKYFLAIVFLYIVIFISLIIPSFNHIKETLTEKHLKENNLIVDNFMIKIEPVLLDHDYKKIKEYMENFVASTIVDSLDIKYTNYYITVNNLLQNSNNIKTKNWVLNDVTIDIKYGQIEKLEDIAYKFIPDDEHRFGSDIEIKFQASNETQMENSISSINFSLPKVTIKPNEIEKNFFDTELEKLINIEKKSIKKKFFIDNTHDYAILSCVTNNAQLKTDIENSLILIWQYYSLVFLSILLVAFGSHIYLQRTTFIKTLKEIDSYLQDISNNNFHKFKGTQPIKQKDILSIINNIVGLTKTISALKNELTNNRNTIESKISSDSLTKLPNRKIFELDMKTLFISDTKSYITKLKLEVLKSFSKENKVEKIDELILDFVAMMEETIQSTSSQTIKLYRLYGSEFVMINEHTDYNKMREFFNLITHNQQTLTTKYNLQEKLFYAVSIPFDRYGTIDKTLNDMEQLYTRTIEYNDLYYIEESQKQDENALKLEKIVTSIIENDAFALSYKFDTFLFSDPTILTMQEVSPNLLNTDGNPIPIATFISVAEHLRLAIQFDKQLIIKTLKYIKQYKIEHDLAINISISSLNDPSFNTWLESQLLFYDKETIERVVFSVTTFAVKNNYEKFAKFISDVKKFNGRILLKRFSYNDLTLAQLEHLDLDFIRVHKDYTTNIDSDRGVLLKNIVSFSEIHDIHLLGDMVTLEKDYELLKKLNFYATCR
ncbi:MAG: EAL domain-containing protein [Arcobacteraceae bacterium]|jgi:EAL domain-containing protein (putative c-di-GMP-specific phosphodiesterase class I)/GGDEF domain-containing protein|nr:EAL domain-containing protein [Arcobacteraceae bacterium]